MSNDNSNGDQYPSPPPQGWVCPICHRVNAPWVVQCPCGGEPSIPPTIPRWPTNPTYPPFGPYMTWMV